MVTMMDLINELKVLCLYHFYV